ARLRIRELTRELVRIRIGARVHIAHVADASWTEPRHHQHSAASLPVVHIHHVVPAQNRGEGPRLAPRQPLQPPFDLTLIGVIERPEGFARGGLLLGVPPEAHIHTLVAGTQPDGNAPIAGATPGAIMLDDFAGGMTACARVEAGISALDGRT